MIPRPVWLLLASALLALMILFAFRRSDDAPPASDENAAPVAVATLADDAAAEPAAAPVDAPPPAPLPAPALPLPPVDAPLADIAAQLRERADAGDSLAACRIALELLRCEQLELTLASNTVTIDESPTPLPRAQEDAVRDLIDHQKIWQLQRVQQCRATPGHLRTDARRYLLQAARAGEPEAMRRYAYGEIVITDGNDFLAGAAFDDWRRDAQAMAQAALRAGDPAAAHLLQLAYAGSNMPFDGLIADDPQQSLAYQLLWRRLRGRDAPAGATAAIDPTMLARADALAERWHRDYFGGRVVDDPAEVFNMPLMVNDDRGQSRELCRRTR